MSPHVPGDQVEWRGIDHPPDQLLQLYRVRLSGGVEAWALYIKPAEWHGWNGKSFRKRLAPIAWRHARLSERSGSESPNQISENPWKKADVPPTFRRNVWVLWEDWAESIGRYLPEMGGWWRVGSDGPMIKSEIGVVGWREYVSDDSGLLILSKNLRSWAQSQSSGLLRVADLLSRTRV